ncbi:MAG: hypothetical protein SFX72_20120 [Isosphaeraceae bacterium]|nr:hypothetical protein [Isosphaeraceae bacterium]
MALQSLDSSPSDDLPTRLGGPRSEEGRAIVSRNALRHGLSGSGLLLPEAEGERARSLEGRLLRDFPPANAGEQLLIRRIAVDSIKAERAQALLIAARARAVERAELLWDEDHRRLALETARLLEDEPERTVAALELTKAGTTWLLERWRLLEELLDRPEGWAAEHRAHALDLLGRPHAFRGERLAEIDDEDSTTRTRLRRDLVERERARLETLLEERHDLLDASDRLRARSGCEPVDDRELRLLQRYEREALRRYQWAWNELQRLRRERTTRNSSRPNQTPPSSRRRDIFEDLGDLDHAFDFDPARHLMQDELIAAVRAQAVERRKSAESLRSILASEPEATTADESLAAEVESTEIAGNRRERRARVSELRKLERRKRREAVPSGV